MEKARYRMTERFIEMKDPELTEALELMLDVFAGGDNGTFIVLLGTVKSMEGEEFAKDWRVQEALGHIKGIGRLLKACRRQSNGELGQTSEETE